MSKLKQNANTQGGFINPRYKRMAWLVLLSFGFTYLFFYNGRQNINIVIDEMAASFHTDKTGLGIVTSSLFWCYAFGQLINGRLGARFGYKNFMIIGVIASAVLNVIISFVDSIEIIAILWGLNGFFQSMVWSNGLGVINKWWPKEKRGFSSGLSTFFSGMAQVVTYLTILLCTELNPEWGWRAAFRYPMIPMILILVAFIMFFHNSPEDVGFEMPKEEATLEEQRLEKDIKEKGYLYPYKVLFSEPKVIVLCLISAIAGIGRYGLLTWIPSYFKNTFDVGIKDGVLGTILLPLGQACAMFIFPVITDKLFKGKREPMLIVASVVTFLGMVVFPFINNQITASIMLFILGVFSMVTGVIWAIAGDIGGKVFSSTVVGVLDWAVYMGAALQSILFAVVEDYFGWAAGFIAIGALYIIMLILTFVAKNMKTKKI